MKKVFEWLTGGVLRDLGKVIDEVVTTKEEREILRNKITTTFLDHALNSDKLKAAIISEEAKGNWLQRSWRPVLMLAFGGIVVFQYFLYPTIKVFNQELPDLPKLMPEFWNLLTLGITGYIVGRSAEKIVPQIEFKKKEK